MKRITLLTLGLFALLSSCVSNNVETDSDRTSTIETTSITEYKLPDTGQSSTYDENGLLVEDIDESSPYWGSDATVEGNVLSYQDNGDGTVTDLNTALMWQQTPDFTRYTYDEALEYVENLEIGGYDDWRLPTIKELYSLAYFNGEIVPDGESHPYIDTDYFDFEYDHLLFAGQYWSSTTYIKNGVQNYDEHGSLLGGFGFNFADGHIKSYETGYYFDGTEISDEDGIMIPGCYVRAVRGTTTLYDMDYTDNGDGTVTDNSTSLMWAQDDSVQTMDWLEALEYANESELAGYSDWRLPNSKELESLVDYEKTDFPAIDTDYFNTTVTDFDYVDDSYYVWTSTTQGDFKYSACYVSFGQAWSKKNSEADTYYDWHGAGAQRSDPKTGNPEDYELASEMASDYISINNYVRLVRDAN
ncbi:MAG: DUF1566 domain-containing protein [Sphaerochaetaceae bacterium]|nr:DUF1566 domain-containing protein [Sphaerochaetaceae bacterium]